MLLPEGARAYLGAMQDELTQLREHVEILETQLRHNSTTSHRAPSSDSPYTKPHQRTMSATLCTVGGKPGHLGHVRCFCAYNLRTSSTIPTYSL